MLRRLLTPLHAFLRDEDGPTAVEYAVMLSLIMVACISAVTTLGGNANDTFGSVVAIFTGGGKSSSSGKSSSGGGSSIGGSYDPGSSVSDGSYTVGWGPNSDPATYNAATGTLTIVSATTGQVIGTSQQTPGVLPNIAAGSTWTRSQ